jgi:hypothetical protein
MNDTDARLWHPWLRVNRLLRLMVHTRWSAEARAEVRVEFKKALALAPTTSSRATRRSTPRCARSSAGSR